MGRISWASRLVAWVLLAGGAVLLPGGPTLAAQPWGGDYFPDVPLTTQDGRTVHLYEDLLKGKLVAINMIFTSCPDSCPLSTANLARVQRLLGDQAGQDIHFYSISIDPEHDTPDVLKAYAEKFHAAPGWLFLTGKPDDIRLAQKKLGLWSSTDAEDPDGHLTSLMVGNEPTGQWMRQSTLDNPRFLATKLSSFLLGWQNQRGALGESYATAKPIDNLDAGRYLFRKTCAACHTIGQGEALGPDLRGVTSRRSNDWLRRFIKAPEQMLEHKDPTALELFARYNQVRMPNLYLGDEDLEALIRYLDNQGAGPAGQADSQPPKALPSHDSQGT
ncbi:cytochrome oxidase Cu insertion factor (SCO1/SenC/PrrC family) [Pseudomonas sp. SJZ079]|uniref:SCO family protein n=1 Tax=Pseudomonas sp. SJZ079 TaxID=2572887 RepID=UPI001198E4C6|nr:SCO family protein [Pseudomonas sp. SJZ079]TWC28397.1 cytochrome oxidase Cu insertion factor (SCO1/SenC/PrrC family) [Pseudomonas sp. SJZ079]